ncbi:ATP-binding cassette sub-family A member 10-like isoform X1 [Nycticebus coucang]|uniref:ATP-binding cassette sub-family A member 10-like isoform X1 n=1 Tax=Nycticebus coucang TaxID=9470 RepID=UPI00234C5F7C|nr:ATP-binding cassette sub-family A member 10-like isoform X1 [Nycticebus coucang]
MLGRIVVLKDLYRDLNKCSDQDIMNYGISMTALKEVLSNLQGKSAIDEPGSNIEDLMHSLLCQDIVLEVDDFSNRNGSDDPSHNGDIIVSGEQKDYRFSVACNTKKMNCFPGLMGIVSNALLGLLDFTEFIQTERNVFPRVSLVWLYIQESTWLRDNG